MQATGTLIMRLSPSWACASGATSTYTATPLTCCIDRQRFVKLSRGQLGSSARQAVDSSRLKRPVGPSASLIDSARRDASSWRREAGLLLGEGICGGSVIGWPQIGCSG